MMADEHFDAGVPRPLTPLWIIALFVTFPKPYSELARLKPQEASSLPSARRTARVHIECVTGEYSDP